jgi:peroxiredoxin
MRAPGTAAACVLLAVLTAGCGPVEPAEGVWRGEIDQYGDPVPFNLEIAREDGELRAWYLNGKERMPVEQVRWAPRGALELNFPSYGAGLTAEVDGDRISGTIRLHKRDRLHELPFTAVHGRSWRFFPQPAAWFADVSGRWEVRIESPALGLVEAGVALFEQSGPLVSGTVQTATGDFRFLHGEMRGGELFLSAFDGGTARLWRAIVQDDGSLAGTLRTVTYRDATWTARRNPAVSLPDPTALTALRPGEERIAFSFPDLDGREVSLGDPRFRDKVVVLIIAGSWCSTCHDEAEVMVPLYEQYRARGLEVVYLMFEYSDRFDEVAGQLRAFRDRFGIRMPMLFAGSTERLSRGEALPMLSDVVAYPTTLVLDRQGKVRRIHTSFPGPATGQAHADYQRDMRAFLNLLLAEAA